MQERYENFVKNNNGKNFFRSARTPGVLFVFLVFDYLLQEIFQLLYLDFLATLCSTILGLILMTMCLWFYTRLVCPF
uniref:Uncharacterized protein n=1 Tax=Romanomermis culicivorax TaxID=13658 RepID=A0A915JW59_ROMCU